MSPFASWPAPRGPGDQVTIGFCTFELHLPGARSLKDKRQVVRSVKERLRARYNVAVTEIEEHADLWQRAGIAVVSIASGRDPLVQLFAAVLREAEVGLPGQVIDRGSDFIEADEIGASEWDAAPR
jgi:uncharacterized protein YlxP (DUF503 family)